MNIKSRSATRSVFVNDFMNIYPRGGISVSGPGCWVDIDYHHINKYIHMYI